ncbi:gliding motility-associated C-terminal domain-containing protein, partial [Lishizhenia tianjinensis]
NVPQFDIAFTPEIDSVGCNDCIPITVDLPQFNSGNYNNYTFDWSPANELNTLQGNQVIACMDSISSTFYLEVTDTVTGCISNDSVTVFINHCGCEYIQHNVTIDSCQTGGVYTLNGELSFYDYPATGNLIINALTNTGNYTDTLFQNFVEDSIYTYTIPNIPQSGGQILITAHFEDESTCADTLILQAPDLPTYTVIQNGNTYCQGDSVYDILLDVELDQSGTLYYTFNGTNQSVSLTPGQVNLGNQEGVYILNSFVDVNCSQYFGDTITIIIHPLPTVNAGTDTSFCVGNTYTLNATGAQTYQWEGGYADQQVLTPTLGQYQFIVEGTDTNSCTNTDTVNITVNNLPEVSFTADTLEGCEPLEVTFTNITQNTQSLTWNINGSNYNTNTVVHEFNAGLFTISLEVTDQNNCLNDTSYTDYIEVHPNPVADFKASNNLINSLDNSVSFTNQSTGATYYQWSFGDGDSSTLVDPIHSYLGNERIVFQVELLVTSTEGCTDIAYQSIELKPELLYYVPNTFTPNGDASNNTFQPVFTSGIDFTSYSLEIYNRGGKLIFETTHANQAWDGTFNGKPVPDGVYTYKIYFTSAANAEREFITGHVNVLR